MNDVTKRRKLTAILYADAQGYSRLMGEDEESTVETITRYRRLFSRCIGDCGGRVVNAPGDSILAEFASAVEAVQCSINIQKQLTSANNELPDFRRMFFRIGMNLGDVIQKGEELYGDGVNIAARVEAMAEAGGICITRSVFDQVKNQLSHLGFGYIGEHKVKNINEPVRVYRINTAQDHKQPTIAEKQPGNKVSSTAYKPVSIAVMPFDNFSGDLDHNYFSVGFVEDLITDLSHFSNLQVISSYTTRKISENKEDPLPVARSLDIDYLLRGSLRRLGGQIRISTQLMEPVDGHVLWAERYEAPVNTLFEIQDDIVARVVNAISTQIDRALLAAARKKPLPNMAAYDFWLRGMARLRQGTPVADQAARKMFHQALTIDPHYSRAYAGLSLSHFNDWSCQLWEQWETTERKAYDYAMQALHLDETDPVVQMIVGRILLFRRQFEQAAHHLDRALALNANDADNLVQIASSMAWLGEAERGEQLFLKGLRLNPYRENWYYTYGAITYFVQQRYDQFIDTALKGPLTEVWVNQPAYLTAAHAHNGNLSEAGDYLGLFEKTFTKEIFKGRKPHSKEMVAWLHKANPFRKEADFSRLVDGLVLAGLESSSTTKPATGSPRKLPDESPMPPNCFIQSGRLWRMTFGGMSIQLPEVKGFLDLAQLMARPGVEAHCSQLMGSPVRVDDRESIIDDKARKAYESRIRELQEEIADAEAMNDLGRSESLEKELDQLTDHLSKALGMGGKIRTVNAPVDRARSAVTWRIRSAIRKIKAAHPALGSHLSNSIRTGTFCCYSPEKDQIWQIERM